MFTIILLFGASPTIATEPELLGFDYQIGQTKNNPVQTDNWDYKNTTLLILRLIDWGQTRTIATEYETEYIAQRTSSGDFVMVEKQVPKYTEHNPILGDQPSEDEVNRYFVLLMGLDWLLNHKAQSDERWAKINDKWIKFNTIVSVYCVGRNLKAGININF